MALGRHHRSISTRRILSGDRAIPISGPLCQNREVVPMKLSPSQYITKSSQSTTFHLYLTWKGWATGLALETWKSVPLRNALQDRFTYVEVHLAVCQQIILVFTYPSYPVRARSVDEIYVVLIWKGRESVVDDLQVSD